MKYVKPTSHRSREKLHGLYPKTIEYYVTKISGGFTGEHVNTIPDALYDAALKIKGISTFCDKGKEVHECWEFI